MSEPSVELKNIIEAALLIADGALSVRKIQGMFPSEACPSADEIRAELEALATECAHRGIELRKVAGGYRYQTREKYAPWLRKLSETRPPRYSRALLETLSIIAYQQPVTRGDIEEIRGVAVSTDIMRALTTRGWVKEIGHRDVPGRPALLGTTREFLEYFNLTSLRELPELADRRDSVEIARELNLELPLDAAPAEPGDGGDRSAADEEMDDDPPTGPDENGDQPLPMQPDLAPEGDSESAGHDRPQSLPANT